MTIIANLINWLRRWTKKYMPYRLKVALAPYIPVIRQHLYIDVRRHPSSTYKELHVDPQGSNYRIQAYERWEKTGRQDLGLTPTIDEIKAALRAHSPEAVLEVGCGHGYRLVELRDEFKIEGCNSSADILHFSATGIRVFEYDVAQPTGAFENHNLYNWDVIYMCGLMHQLMETTLQTTYVMNNLLMLARKKIIVWDWPEVCLWMQQFSDSPKFEYHPLTPPGE
jgi:hypothetical protein